MGEAEYAQPLGENLAQPAILQMGKERPRITKQIPPWALGARGGGHGAAVVGTAQSPGSAARPLLPTSSPLPAARPRPESVAQ